MKEYNNVTSLLESEETQKLFEGQEELLNEANEVIAGFPAVLTEVVCNHPREFLGENVDETIKNIRVFAEVATAQFVHEVTQIYADEFPVQEEVVEEEKDVLSEYL